MDTSVANGDEVRYVRLSQRLRQGFVEAIEGPEARTAMEMAQAAYPALRGLSLTQLPSLARRGRLSDDDCGKLYAAVVRAYRRGPRALWAAVLLEMLAPILVNKVNDLCRQYRPDWSADVADPEAAAARRAQTISHEDLESEAIFQALNIAFHADLPLTDGRWVERHITESVARNLRRNLIRARRLGEAQEDEADAAGIPSPDRGLSDKARARRHALNTVLTPAQREMMLRLGKGEREVVLAAELGITLDAFYVKVSRLRHRLRAAEHAWLYADSSKLAQAR